MGVPMALWFTTSIRSSTRSPKPWASVMPSALIAMMVPNIMLMISFICEPLPTCRCNEIHVKAQQVGCLQSVTEDEHCS